MSDRKGQTYAPTLPLELEAPVAAPAAGHAAGRAASAELLRQIKAVVVLSGSVRQSELRLAIGRSTLDLPIAPSTTLLDVWRRHVLRLAQLADSERVPMRILSDGASSPPTLAAGDAEIGITVECDPESLRGTGGVLHDICDAYTDDDYVLVATAAQVLVEPLGDLASALLRSGGDFALIAHHDGTPISLMLLRCGALRQIPDRGFVDMKEQVLPKIAATRPTSVLTRRQPVGLPVRTLREYTQALHFNQRLSSGASDVHDPFAETWASRVAIVERGATVHRSAHLHDSVVLAGGCVEENAVVVRSVVCPGGVIRRGQTVVDALATCGKVRR